MNEIPQEIPQEIHCTHSYVTPRNQKGNERKTLAVVILTAAMMVAEIAGGWITGSMALLADGWHMGTHAGALGLTLFAYHFARKHQSNPLYSFGTGKVTTLGGFASAVVLGVVALLIGFESLGRLLEPVPINFDEAIFIAAIGLIVNIASAMLLHEGHGHHHHEHDHHGHGAACDHDHSHGHEHHHQEDHNIKAAYMHVLADALTSVTAIIALLLGKYFGWGFMDPLMGLVGSLVIAKWSLGLIRDTSHILLDRAPDEKMLHILHEAISKNDADKITDLHLWATAPGHFAVVLSVETSSKKDADSYKKLLQKSLPQIQHVTIEINRI